MSEQKEMYTVGEWLDVWLEVYAPVMYKLKTLDSYRDSRDRMKRNCPELEQTILIELRPIQFQRCLNQLAEKNYSKSTISHVRTVYNQAYQSAVSNRLCAWNPISDCAIDSKAPVKKVTALNQDEQQAFEGALRKLPVRDQFALEAFLITGLRRNELRNLTWDDWDKVRNNLLVRDSKTEAGIRKVPIIPELALILIHLEHLRKPGDTPYIFTHQGKQVTIGHLRWICKKAAKLAGIRHVHPHVLRHSFATRAVEKKMGIKSLATIIGHTDVSFTMRTYVDLDDDSYLHEEMMCLSSSRHHTG